jgi:NAD(P)-dependent dehydrogenase (short-subunit alcohol dehydrogenase family)
MIQANLLSPALLALELLPLLEKTGATKGIPSRPTWVGSFVKFQHSLTSHPVSHSSSILTHFSDPSKFVAGAQHPDSKLFGTLFVRRLATTVDRKSVVVNEVSPGMVKTGFGVYPLWMMAVFGAILFVREGAGGGWREIYSRVGCSGEREARRVFK